ncbi:hypothetical protein HAALTHF_39240n [Vreelandella aquamarina]|nr:hypothetical protein HAALTHF_39240n [Halomonas axialensis]
MRIASYMERMIRTTTDAFEVSGLDKLDDNSAYLFIGNHRDISLDPAFVNYALYQAGRDTVRIAIGDNLLKKPYVTDLMRLNKSFIVPRSCTRKAGHVGRLSAAVVLHSPLDYRRQSLYLDGPARRSC